MNLVKGHAVEPVQSSRNVEPVKDDANGLVFLRPRPFVNPLIARWRFLERMAATGGTDFVNSSHRPQTSK